MAAPTFQHLFRPGTDPAAPPLLLLHGTGGSEHDLVPIADFISPGSALLSPRGHVQERGARRFFSRLAEGVFDPEEVTRRTHELADFLSEAEAAAAVDPTRLIAIGFSNGANAAANLLLLRPEVLGGAILIRAMVVLDQPAPRGSLQGRPILLLNGERDPLVPADHPPRLANLLQAGGARVTPLVLPAGHGLTQGDLQAARGWFQQLSPNQD